MVAAAAGLIAFITDGTLNQICQVMQLSQAGQLDVDNVNGEKSRTANLLCPAHIYTFIN
jgi:hypothetical protein